MGAQKSKESIYYDPTLSAELIDETKQYKIYRNQQGDQFEKYKIKHKANYDFQNRYDYRIRNNSPYLVDAYSAKASKNAFGCSSAEEYEVVTQRIPLRLDSLTSLSGAESLNMLNTALKGFQQIYKSQGVMLVKDTMIGINKDNHVKVWMNSNFACNQIEQPPISYGVLSDGEKQCTMVDNIVELINSRAKRDPEWVGFVQEKHRLGRIGFEQAIKLSQFHASKNNVKIVDSFYAANNTNYQNQNQVISQSQSQQSQQHHSAIRASSASKNYQGQELKNTIQTFSSTSNPTFHMVGSNPNSNSFIDSQQNRGNTLQQNQGISGLKNRIIGAPTSRHENLPNFNNSQNVVTVSSQQPFSNQRKVIQTPGTSSSLIHQRTPQIYQSGQQVQTNSSFPVQLSRSINQINIQQPVRHRSTSQGKPLITFGSKPYVPISGNINNTSFQKSSGIINNNFPQTPSNVNNFKSFNANEGHKGSIMETLSNNINYTNQSTQQQSFTPMLNQIAGIPQNNLKPTNINQNSKNIMLTNSNQQVNTSINQLPNIANNFNQAQNTQTNQLQAQAIKQNPEENKIQEVIKNQQQQQQQIAYQFPQQQFQLQKQSQQPVLQIQQNTIQSQFNQKQDQLKSQSQSSSNFQQRSNIELSAVQKRGIPQAQQQQNGIVQLSVTMQQPYQICEDSNLDKSEHIMRQMENLQKSAADVKNNTQINSTEVRNSSQQQYNYQDEQTLKAATIQKSEKSNPNPFAPLQNTQKQQTTEQKIKIQQTPSKNHLQINPNTPYFSRQAYPNTNTKNNTQTRQKLTQINADQMLASEQQQLKKIKQNTNIIGQIREQNHQQSQDSREGIKTSNLTRKEKYTNLGSYQGEVNDKKIVKTNNQNGNTNGNNKKQSVRDETNFKKAVQETASNIRMESSKISIRSSSDLKGIISYKDLRDLLKTTRKTNAN